MKDAIWGETFYADSKGDLYNLHHEIVTICGESVEFQYPEFEYASGRWLVRAYCFGFRKSKGKILRKKIQQYIEWIGRMNIKFLEEGLDPQVRRKWY